MGVEVEEAKKKGRCIRDKKNGWSREKKRNLKVITQRKQRTNKRIIRKEIHQTINHE